MLIFEQHKQIISTNCFIRPFFLIICGLFVYQMTAELLLLHYEFLAVRERRRIDDQWWL